MSCGKQAEMRKRSEALTVLASDGAEDEAILSWVLQNIYNEN